MIPAAVQAACLSSQKSLSRHMEAEKEIFLFMVRNRILPHGYVLTPGRYVGAEDVEDDGEPFDEKMKRLTAKLEEQFAESARLEKVIRENLKGLGDDL